MIYEGQTFTILEHDGVISDITVHYEREDGTWYISVKPHTSSGFFGEVSGPAYPDLIKNILKGKLAYELSLTPLGQAMKEDD